MTELQPDARYGHDLAQVQDENGVDLLRLKKQLELSVEERFRRLEQHIEFVRELRASAKR